MAETVDQRTLWDAAGPGDQLPPYDGWPCGVADLDLQLVCTRQHGHRPGTDHVATAGGVVVARWAPAAGDNPVPSLDTLLHRRDGGKLLGQHLQLLGGELR